MPPTEGNRPEARSETEVPDAFHMVDLYRNFSDHKRKGTGAAVNHNTISVWAGTLILCSILVFGLYQMRGRVQGVQEELERIVQDNRLLLEGLDELLARTEQLDRVAVAVSPAPAEPAEKSAEEKKDLEDNLSTRYKIYYRTKVGEDLAEISEKFAVPQDRLRLWNALKPTDALIPGQVVVINKSAVPDKPMRIAHVSPPPEPRASLTKREIAAEEGPASQEDRSDRQTQTQEARDETTAEGKDLDGTDSLRRNDESMVAESEQMSTESAMGVAGEPAGRIVEEPIEEIIHTVQANETLSGIGQKYGVSWTMLAERNRISRPDTLYEGQRLKIRTDPTRRPADSPEGITHTVRTGENLYRIGLKYGISWEKIARENKILNSSRLFEGQVLKIPAARGGPEHPPADH